MLCSFVEIVRSDFPAGKLRGNVGGRCCQNVSCDAMTTVLFNPTISLCKSAEFFVFLRPGRAKK